MFIYKVYPKQWVFQKWRKEKKLERQTDKKVKRKKCERKDVPIINIKRYLERERTRQQQQQHISILDLDLPW